MVLQGLKHLVFADQLSILIADANSQIIYMFGARAERNFVADSFGPRHAFMDL
jgi:hypothetical protein